MPKSVHDKKTTLLNFKMTRHNFRFRRPTFQHTIMADGQGTTWLAQVAKKWHNELADGCKGLLAARCRPSWRKKNSPRDITHKMVGNKIHPRSYILRRIRPPYILRRIRPPFERQQVHFSWASLMHKKRVRRREKGQRSRNTSFDL